MYTRQCLAPEGSEEWKMKKVRVEMNDVKQIGAAHHAIEKDQMVGKRISAAGIATQCPLANSLECRIGMRVAAGEQGYVVPLTNEFLR